MLFESERIFGLSSPTKSPRLDVGKNVSDDLPKVGGAQRPLLQVLTVPPAGQRDGWKVRHLQKKTLTDPWLN